MPILRQESYTSYTVYPNESLKLLAGNGAAVGLHLYLLSKNDGWNVRSSDIEDFLGCGRDMRRKTMKTLQDAGLLRLERIPGGGSEWVVFDVPSRQTDFQAPGGTDFQAPGGTGSPTVGKSTPLVNTEYSSNDTEVNTEKPPVVPQIPFADFWSVYPNRKGKAPAEASWGRLSREDRERAIDDVKRRKAKDPDWLKDNGKFIPHASTYVNQKRWLDEWEPEAKDDLGYVF